MWKVLATQSALLKSRVVALYEIGSRQSNRVVTLYEIGSRQRKRVVTLYETGSRQSNRVVTLYEIGSSRAIESTPFGQLLPNWKIHLIRLQKFL